MSNKNVSGTVGSNPHQSSSKSILTTSDTGYNIELPKPQPEIKKPLLEEVKIEVSEPEIVIKENSLQTTFKTGFEQNNIVIIEPPEPIQKPLITIKTGVEHNDTPVVTLKQECHKNEDSIIKDIDTGFGECKTIEKDCPKPKFKSHLYKENYLSEFKTETEKRLVRENIGVYGKPEIVAVIKTEVSKQGFIGKDDVEKIISDLDFVNSTLKSYADYQIPNSLFKI